VKVTTPTFLVVIILFALIVSGCICCCGLDSQLSKYKKSVSILNLTNNTTIDGTGYQLNYTDTRLNRTAVKSGVLDILGLLGYPPEDVEYEMNQSIDTSGVNEYRYFNYTDATGEKTLGIYVAKTDSPLVTSTSFESLKQLLTSSMWFINDHDYNWGGVNNVSYNASSKVGDGGEKYRAKVYGRDSYTVIIRYSNLYVLAYSFESFQVAEEAARVAIRQIDLTAADP